MVQALTVIECLKYIEPLFKESTRGEERDGSVRWTEGGKRSKAQIERRREMGKLYCIFERGGRELQALTIIEFVFMLCALSLCLSLSLFTIRIALFAKQEVYLFFLYLFQYLRSAALYATCAIFCFRFLVFLFCVFSFLVINCRVTRAGCASREKHKNNKTKDNL